MFKQTIQALFFKRIRYIKRMLSNFQKFSISIDLILWKEMFIYSANG